MAEGKKSFTAYCDWIDTFEELSDEEAGQLIKHLFRYVNDQDPEPPNRIIKLLFASIKATLKRDLNKWEDKREVNRKNGKKGGRPKKAKETEKTQSVNSKAKKGVSVSVSVSDSVSNTPYNPPEGEFERFWNLYDKKQGKHTAKRAWGRLSAKDKECLFNHVPKYKAATPDKQYRQKPTTYLNQRTWEDEHLPQPKQNGQYKPQEVKMPQIFNR